MTGMRRTTVFRVTSNAPCSVCAAPYFSGIARVLIQTLLGTRASSHLVAYVSWGQRDRTCTQPPPPAVTQALRGRRPEMHRSFDISLPQLDYSPRTQVVNYWYDELFNSLS